MQPVKAASEASTVIATKCPTKYPNNSCVDKLSSPLEVKKWWLYNEWHPKCSFSKYIQKDFRKQADLHPQNGNAETRLIESVFDSVRGQFTLWGQLREKGRWRKVVVERLELKWVQENVDVLFPSEEVFEVQALNGVVLWKDPTKKKYQLLEGNHRVSSWLRTGKPEALSSIIFIGKSAK